MTGILHLRCQCIKYMKQTYLYMSTSFCNASFTHFILLAALLIEHTIIITDTVTTLWVQPWKFCGITAAKLIWLLDLLYVPKKCSIQCSNFFGLKAHQEQKSIQDFKHIIGTVLTETKCVQIYKFKNGSTSVTDPEPQWPSTSNADYNNTHLCHDSEQQESLLMKWKIICKPVFVPPMRSSTTDYSS